MIHPALLWLARLSLVYNAVILAAVAADLDWVRSRAAGGSFSSFPAWIRVVYAVQALVMIILLWSLPRTRGRWASALAALFIVSTLAQLLSRSANERWNAIPAAVLATTYLLLSRRSASADSTASAPRVPSPD